MSDHRISAAGDVLRLAREKISKPENWTQGALARRVYGSVARPRDPDATCFCMSGAVISALGGDPDWRAFNFLIDITSPSVPEWNDAPERTHAEVLAAFDRAISLADKGVMP